MKVSLRTANSILLCIIVVINLYIISAPLLPIVSFWWRDHHTSTRQTLTDKLHTSPKTQNGQTIATANSIIIPSMLVDQPILDGPVSNQYNLLKAGIWRIPFGSSPDKGSNTIFAAHRFSYTGPRGAFYDLNKVKIGDEIGIYWKNKKYVYKVTSTGVVPPTQTSIEDATSDARITLFTCTPLWNPVNRLVVVAELEKNA